jgi:hypothetical protein
MLMISDQRNARVMQLRSVTHWRDRIWGGGVVSVEEGSYWIDFGILAFQRSRLAEKVKRRSAGRPDVALSA